MSKNKTNKNDKKNEKLKTTSSSSIGKLFVISAILGGLASYYMFKVMTTPPPLPKLDLNHWWGQYPMEPKPDVSIRPYKIEFSDALVNDLKERLLHHRPSPPPLEGAGFTYGFNSNFLNKVVDYWRNQYNFKDREQFLNKFNHYMTKIQGLDIHFIHVKPEAPSGISVVPLLMLHGWPGSVREFYEMIPLLTKPQEGKNFVFEVIAPSLPGYGFSQAPVRPGMGYIEIAVIMKNLMSRLGHSEFYVQGGDYGHAIGSSMATLFPSDVLGFHTNFPMVMNHPLGIIHTFVGSLFPRLLVEPELESRMYPLSEHMAKMVEETGYVHIQATKPDTIGTALSDSPAGLAAYILEKFSTWTNIEYKKAGDGNLLKKFTLVHLLDNVMIYWASNCITTSMRLYAESLNSRQMAMKMDRIQTDVPTWGIKFKHEIMFQPDTILKLKYKNYLRSTVVEDGGHFAAFENPDIMATDIFEAVNTFRQFHGGNYEEDSKRETKPIPSSIYEFTVKDINGNLVKLDKYKGHVLIIVNVASQCGLTDTNYEQLNDLYEKYSKTKGLRILAFPCNQFNGQEPGNSKEILSFTKSKGVKFDIFEKVDVNGDSTHPLWLFLKNSKSGYMGDFIKWNFSKFIVDKNGIPVERLGPNVNPIDLVPVLEKYW